MSAITLCLVRKWIAGGDPAADLKDLNIEPQLFEEEIESLYSKGFLEKPINEILKKPKEIRQAHVFTKKGERVCNSFSLDKLKYFWKRWGKD